MESRVYFYVLFSGQIVESCATRAQADAIAAQMRAHWAECSEEERLELEWEDCSVDAIYREIEVIGAAPN